MSYRPKEDGSYVSRPVLNETSASYSLSPWPGAWSASGSGISITLASSPGARAASMFQNHLDPGFEFRVGHALDSARMLDLQFPRDQKHK